MEEQFLILIGTQSTQNKRPNLNSDKELLVILERKKLVNLKRKKLDLKKSTLENWKEQERIEKRKKKKKKKKKRKRKRKKRKKKREKKRNKKKMRTMKKV